MTKKNTQSPEFIEKQKELIDFIISADCLPKNIRKVVAYAVSSSQRDGVDPEMCGHLAFVSMIADFIEELLES